MPSDGAKFYQKKLDRVRSISRLLADCVDLAEGTDWFEKKEGDPDYRYYAELAERLKEVRQNVDAEAVALEAMVEMHGPPEYAAHVVYDDAAISRSERRCLFDAGFVSYGDGIDHVLYHPDHWKPCDASGPIVDFAWPDDGKEAFVYLTARTVEALRWAISDD